MKYSPPKPSKRTTKIFDCRRCTSYVEKDESKETQACIVKENVEAHLEFAKELKNRMDENLNWVIWSEESNFNHFQFDGNGDSKLNKLWNLVNSISWGGVVSLGGELVLCKKESKELWKRWIIWIFCRAHLPNIVDRSEMKMKS